MGYIDDGNVHQLPDGRWYISQGGKVTFISPVAMGGQKPAGGGGLFHGNETFNQNTGQWETPLDWGKIGSMVAAGLLTAGAANALMAGGGAAAAGGGGGAAAGAGAPAAAAAATGAGAAADVGGTAALDAAWGGGAAAGGGGGAAAAGAAPLAASVMAPASVAPVAGLASGSALAAGDGVGLLAAAPGAATGLGWQTALKYGLPVVGSAVDNVLANQRANKQLQAEQSNTALTQSKLDPFRGQMQQASDAAQLERAANPPKPYGPAPGSRYAGASDPNGGYKSYTPSSTYLNTVRNAQANVMAGKGTVPNQLDPNNWGATGVSDLTAPTTAPPGSTLAAPTLSPATLIAKQRAAALAAQRRQQLYGLAAA